MIIHITSSNDASTDAVIDWIDYLGSKSMRINTDKLSPSDINMLCVSNQHEQPADIGQYKFESVSSVWFRRPALNIFNTEVAVPDTNHQVVNSFLEHEAKQITNHIYYLYTKAKIQLGNPSRSSVNKLEMLSKARDCNLKIPETLITSKKSVLVDFKNKYHNIITKPVYEAPTFNPNGKLYQVYTEEVTDEVIDKCPDTFFPSLFQEKLDKEVELRVFYLDGRFYATAIFSQNDNQTCVDFRRYNTKRPNRKVPFELPKQIKKNLHDFMRELGLNSGSIDLILTTKGAYVFLEINPVGQYGMISSYCNAILSKEIAKYLIGYENTI